MSQFYCSKSAGTREVNFSIGGDKEGKDIFEFDSDVDEGLPLGVGESLTLKNHLRGNRFQTIHIHVFADVDVDTSVEWNEDPLKVEDWASSISFNMPATSPLGVGKVASVQILARYFRLNIANADLLNPVTSLKFSIFAFPI